MSLRPPAIAADIIALFAERGAEPVDVSILQPADPFLDMAGEDLRRRIFLTESETGGSLCLRPEFTIPVCLDHIASHAGTPRRYAYLGEVFRQRRDGPSEFFQTGIEDLGERDVAVADAHALLERLLPGRKLAVTLGDQSVFEAVLAALGLPRGWRMRLARAFGVPDILASALEQLAAPAGNGMLEEPVASLVAAADLPGLSLFIGDEMRGAGLSPSAGRKPDDIARRLLEKSELASVRLSETALDALKTFLAIDEPFDRAAETLAEFAREAKLSMGAALARFAERAEALATHGLRSAEIRYDAAFGRPLDYYTGLVFEIAADGGERPLVGGGRYDRLLTLLGARNPIPAVGFSVWLDRVEVLRGGAWGGGKQPLNREGRP
jgi:ATP phosphoribosyltransferase regulatory subunit